MVFQRSKITYFICITVGFFAAWELTVNNSRFNYGTYFRLGLFTCYLIIILAMFFSKRKKIYILENDKITFKTTNADFELKISEIDYIREVWTVANNSNMSEYEIVLRNNLEEPIKVDATLVNKKGKSLITVLESEHDIKFNRI